MFIFVIQVQLEETILYVFASVSMSTGISFLKLAAWWINYSVTGLYYIRVYCKLLPFLKETLHWKSALIF